MNTLNPKNFESILQQQVEMIPKTFARDKVSEPENEMQLENLARFDELKIVTSAGKAEILRLGQTWKSEDFCTTAIIYSGPIKEMVKIYSKLKVMAECGVGILSKEAGSTKVAAKDRSELYGKWTLVQDPINRTFHYIVRLDIPFVI